MSLLCLYLLLRTAYYSNADCDALVMLLWNTEAPSWDQLNALRRRHIETR